jgi:pantoate--beta-alanine ligase
MKVISEAKEMRTLIQRIGLSPIGFVPTMGALHDGHVSLVKTAVKLCPIVVVSIYVNPTQFNDKNDLKNYPRSLDKDLLLLKKVMRDSDLVFTPEDKEIYPKEDKRVFDFGNLGKVMEALHRPGHFNGVAQVVSRLFEIVEPDVAIFGMKDFQQLAVIKELVRQTNNKVKIVGNPIVREIDGLAMSSRNVLLKPDIRKNASIIFKTLSSAASLISASDIPEIKLFVEQSIGNAEGFEVEYFDIVDDTELIPVKKKSEMQITKKYFGCIAVRAGEIRLIDNIGIGLV